MQKNYGVNRTAFALLARHVTDVYDIQTCRGIAVAEGKKRAAKTESLTIRLDPRTRFLLEFVSRVKGQTITTVVERALLDAADSIKVLNGDTEMTWKDFWNICEGMRALQIAEVPSLYPTFEEERRYEFARQHWPFFCSSMDFDEYLVRYIDILWPNIDKYVEIWETERSKDWHSAARAMHKAISDAGLSPPDWQKQLLDGDASSENSTEPSPAPPKSRRRS
jgi:hypothetical protein